MYVVRYPYPCLAVVISLFIYLYTYFYVFIYNKTFYFFGTLVDIPLSRVINSFICTLLSD